MLGEQPFSTSGDSFPEEMRRSNEATGRPGRGGLGLVSGPIRRENFIGSRSSARQIQQAMPTRTNRLSDGVLVDNGFSPTERRASQERGAATIQEDLVLRALPRTRRAVVRCDAVRVGRSRFVAPKGE